MARKRRLHIIGKQERPRQLAPEAAMVAGSVGSYIMQKERSGYTSTAIRRMPQKNPPIAENKKVYMSMCVCICVQKGVCVCVHLCMRPFVSVCVCVCLIVPLVQAGKSGLGPDFRGPGSGPKVANSY